MVFIGTRVVIYYNYLILFSCCPPPPSLLAETPQQPMYQWKRDAAATAAAVISTIPPSRYDLGVCSIPKWTAPQNAAKKLTSSGVNTVWSDRKMARVAAMPPNENSVSTKTPTRIRQSVPSPAPIPLPISSSSLLASWARRYTPQAPRTRTHLTAAPSRHPSQTRRCRTPLKSCVRMAPTKSWPPHGGESFLMHYTTTHWTSLHQLLNTVEVK